MISGYKHLRTRAGLYASFFILFIFISCGDNQVEPNVVQTGLPEVLTGEVTNTNSTSATVSGQVVSDGNSQVTERGIVIGVNPEPTVGDFKFTSGNGKGTFSVEIAGLQTGTTYQVRAYASNAKGTSYGVNKSFNTTDLNPIYLDANGITVKCYDWAKVGDKGTLNGKEYLIVDREQLMARIWAGWDCSTLCTTKVEDMSGIFNSYLFLDESEISSWDVSNVYNMYFMFSGSSFNGDISAWDVSNVSSMGNMFNSSLFNGDISNWDVSKVAIMDGMFENSKFEGDISQWNVVNVNTMNNMFTSSAFSNDISNWNVSRVAYMYYMFAYSSFNNDISNWNVGNVMNMEGMFIDNKSFNQDLSGWNVTNVNSCTVFSSGADNWTLPQPNFTNCQP